MSDVIEEIIKEKPIDKIQEGLRKGYFRLLNDNAKIEYLPQEHKEQFNDSEEKVRADYYFDLLEKYQYPGRRISFEIEIPISYGRVEEFRYKKGDANWDIKVVDQDELKRAFQKCHDTLWAGGKRSPTTAFDEFAKIIFVKIRDEKKGRRVGEPYDFQIKTHEPAESVYARINGIYLEARERDPEVFKENLRVEPEEL